MAEPTVIDRAAGVIAEAEALRDKGETRGAIDRLVAANRAERDSRIECALVDFRLQAGREVPNFAQPAARDAIAPDGSGGEVFEVDADGMDLDALRTGIARSGCLLVRGLVDAHRAARLAEGIDSALTAFDASDAGESVDPAWFTKRPIQDRAGSSDGLARKLNREMGALWTVFSPRMVFELLTLVDDVGIGPLMTEFLGERPVLSANKCTLRRVPPQDLYTGWHQDGAFLGDTIGSFNFWLSLSQCGVDAPGLDIVPKRFDHILPTGTEGAVFKWSLSDQMVEQDSEGVEPVRPQFEPGDALLFDHRLVHRTASSAAMPRERYAIESWFFTPSSYPNDQVALLY
jgi:ectoine hydroxylase-related dioxygenase (phytanoyl-CoA dioxygenase family)